MTSTVYFASSRQARLSADETLPLKLDRILEKLRIRDRVKDQRVAIKMHLGGHVGYSTIHPVFVRRVVQAVKEGGGRPFVTDTSGACASSAQRGYSEETLGCPIAPTGGLDEKYFYRHEREYKNIREWLVGGAIQDADFLVDLSHVKGHPSCGFGAAFKNLALGTMMGPTRGAIHDTVHFDQYWFPDKCPDAETRKKIIDSCPHGALVQDKENEERIHMHYEPCNQCGRCLKVAPDGSLVIRKENFQAFQEASAIATGIVLSTFEPENRVFINIANQITPVCDCFGFTGMSILPDVGIFGSDDIVAADTATLDRIVEFEVSTEGLPLSMEAQPGAGHPFQVIHGPYKDPYDVCRFGEKLGLGSSKYELVDVFPLDESARPETSYIAASDM
jgi:uncharacterized Fe-S center protein